MVFRFTDLFCWIVQAGKDAMHYLEPINETSYLSVPNAPVYRQIMRCFYREYEKMNFQLYKEDVLELLKKEEQFS